MPEGGRWWRCTPSDRPRIKIRLDQPTHFREATIMTIPSGVAKVTVTGTLGAGGVAASGSIEFAPSVDVDYTGLSWVDTLAPFVATLVGGAFSIILPATDDSAGTPSSWTYRVTERLSWPRTPFSMAVLSASGSTQDYSTLVPIGASSHI